MNIRVVLAIWLVLGFPLWRALINGTLDPDQAAIKLAVAGVIAVAVEAVIRMFVTATRTSDESVTPGDSESDTSKNIS